MSYKSEKEMYPEVASWLRKLLIQKYKKARITVDITPNIKLCYWLERKKLQNFFKEYISYDIKIDVVGAIIYDNKADLVFIECKRKSITLKDVAQLLGYSRVARPILSFIIFPGGLSRPLGFLLDIYGRYDILTYDKDLNRVIRIAKWNASKKSIDLSSITPPGYHI